MEGPEFAPVLSYFTGYCYSVRVLKCSECGEQKDPTQFNRASGSATGRQAYCRVCQRTKSAGYQRKSPRRCGSCHDPSPPSGYNKGQGVCRACNATNGAAYRKTPKAKIAARNRNLIRNFGINSEEYDRMLGHQRGVCAICGRAGSPERGILDVDHCHDTGVVRGLLCTLCNRGLGQFKDDLGLVEKAAAYLKRSL